jgi:hypothetical protein
MIISHQHKFIFTAIPKTGTHAVRRALREHLGPQDQEQVGLFVQKRFDNETLAAIKHGHVTLAQLRPHLSPEAFASYFKFAFVRNPFDRFVSFCAFMTRDGGAFERNPRGVMRHFLERAPQDQVLFKPQHIFIVDENGALLTDAIGRVEEMQRSYETMCARIGVPSAELERDVNASRHEDYRSYYTPSLVDGVAALYARDLELFGYAFEGAAA